MTGQNKYQISPKNGDKLAIVAGSRTPIGCFQGVLQHYSAPELGAIAIEAASSQLSQLGLSEAIYDEVIMGCVLTAGMGQGPARQAARLAKIPDHVCATTINKLCGSGMKSIMLASNAICAGAATCIIAGGMESMSNAPFLLPKLRSGIRLGHQSMYDHMLFDGLEDAYSHKLMGVFAEEIAAKYNINRKMMDEFATASLLNARKAIQDNLFSNEISHVVPKSKHDALIIQDELPSKAKIEKIKNLKPVFHADGSITAANASAISDGATALIIMSESQALKHGLTPVAFIAGQTECARHPSEFALAPIDAMNKLFEQTGWSKNTVDLYEINEAFAVVTLLAINALSLDRKQVNIHGGACALGHPIGASGARIILTLLHALKQHGGRRGIASLCIGGGEATAMAIELPD